MKTSIDHLEADIRASWSCETSVSPNEWDAETNPARGQCVPTSLVVQDYLGGDLERLATEFQAQLLAGAKVVAVSIYN